MERKRVKSVFPPARWISRPACRPGATHLLSVLVVALPMKGVMLSYTDSASAREVKGSVAAAGLVRRRLSGRASRRAAHIGGAKVDTSVRKGRSRWARRWRISRRGTLSLRARVADGRDVRVKEFDEPRRFRRE